MTDKIRPPWTLEQVSALNDYQRSGVMHPFTCGHEHPAHPNAILTAMPDGWRCHVLGCDYEQDWAHEFMANPAKWPQFPFGERHGPTPQEAASALRGVPQASGGELAGQSGDRGAQAASSDALRQRIIESLDDYPVACWTTRNLAGRVMGVVGGELDRWEKAARQNGELYSAAENQRDEAREQLARVRKVVAERRAEVAEREADGMLEFGTPGASWCDAVTVTCDRIDDALRVFPEPGWIRCNDDQTQEQP